MTFEQRVWGAKLFAGIAIAALMAHLYGLTAVFSACAIEDLSLEVGLVLVAYSGSIYRCL